MSEVILAVIGFEKAVNFTQSLTRNFNEILIQHIKMLTYVTPNVKGNSKYHHHHKKFPSFSDEFTQQVEHLSWVFDPEIQGKVFDHCVCII